VIGGKNTEVTEETKNVLLESAYFDPVLVRRASRRHKLSTESSYRFERGVDWEGAALASRRAADLIAASGGGEVFPMEAVEKHSKKTVGGSRTVVLRFDRLNRLLGIRIPERRVTTVLTGLGFEVKRPKKDRALVNVGSWRRDLSQEADLVEEVLRIEGFDKIPSTLPATHHEEESVEDKKAALALELKKFLAALGFREIITYSLLSKKALADSGFEEWRRAQKIANPVSAEQEFLRPGLLPGMLQVIHFNICRKASSFKLFEIGNCYVDDKEETILALSLYGALEENWQRKSPATFYDLKGAVESALRFLNAGEGEWREEVPCPEPGRRASPYARGSSLWIKGVEAVRLGEVGKDLLAKWDIPKEVYFAELLLDRVLAARKSETFFKVKPTPRFPSVRRDIAFIIDEGVRAVDLEKAMREEGAPHLQEVVLFDRYAGKNVPEGKQSLAFSLFYRKEGTFTDEEINALQARVTEGLKERYGVEFR
ncbi:MAG: phenylalanine--tRNA ligase subunit beta, partial [Candidatus Omnitrophica bacterium]|nr:phenylalanine--tRNA ligase subunit beta [Candidatus Omnitrophota bacterium]